MNNPFTSDVFHLLTFTLPDGTQVCKYGCVTKQHQNPIQNALGEVITNLTEAELYLSGQTEVEPLCVGTTFNFYGTPYEIFQINPRAGHYLSSLANSTQILIKSTQHQTDEMGISSVRY